ncbi:MAG: transketolase C-terminal domain-containing protein, partial [Candidatus Spechtbacterales bacterium]
YAQGKDVTIVANGPLVHTALLAAQELEKENISCEVINCPTVKPLDGTTIEKSVRKTGALVTAEEHQVMGGLGSAVAEYVSAHYAVPQEFIGVQDRFGESGEPDELFEKFGMGVKDIQEAVRKVIKRK